MMPNVKNCFWGENRKGRLRNLMILLFIGSWKYEKLTIRTAQLIWVHCSDFFSSNLIMSIKKRHDDKFIAKIINSSFYRLLCCIIFFSNFKQFSSSFFLLNFSAEKHTKISSFCYRFFIFFSWENQQWVENDVAGRIRTQNIAKERKTESVALLWFSIHGGGWKSFRYSMLPARKRCKVFREKSCKI